MTTTELTTSTETPVRWTVPPVDVLERARDLRLLVDLPGVRQEDLSITVEEGRLHLSARRADRGYRRAFDLPEHVDTEAIEARLSHGVLTLDLPAAARVRPRTIPVAVG